MSLEEWFNWTWSQLAEHGLCDAPGGAEYCRVLLKWKIDQYPTAIISYILLWANRPTTEAAPSSK